MASPETLHQLRDQAGAAYAAAARAYVLAFCELHAFDLALHINSGFGGEFRYPNPHPAYLPDYLHGANGDRVAARVAELHAVA